MIHENLNPIAQALLSEIGAAEYAVRYTRRSLDEYRAKLKKEGPSALSVVNLSELDKRVQDAADAVDRKASAEQSFARVASAMSGNSAAPWQLDVSAVVEELMGWASQQGSTLETIIPGMPCLGMKAQGPSPVFIAKRDAPRALALDTTDYPSVPTRRPIVSSPVTALNVLDLMPIVPVDTEIVDVPVETGFTNTAAETKEGAEAPELELVIELTQVPSRWVAATLPATARVLDSAGLLERYLRTRMIAAVRERLQHQVINGTGDDGEVGDVEMHGLLARTLPTVAAPAGTLADHVHAGLTAVQKTTRLHYSPNALLIHPDDAELLDTEKTEVGGAEYVSGGPSAYPATWQLPHVISIDVPEGAPMVGDLRACELYVRDDVRVDVSRSHKDFFRRGHILFRAQGRFSLGVLNVDAFAVLEGFGAA